MMFGLILIGILAYYLINSANSNSACCMNHQSSAQTPLDTLNERYAHGEIDREEYLERKQVLSGQKQTIR